jgi:ribosomal protein S18 acetylase RimI-like enzyme
MARGSVDHGEPSSAFLTAVFVAPEWRTRGLGRAVSAAAVDWARQRGLDSIRLHVADWNDPARRLYESLGFQPTGATEPMPHDATITEIEMSLRLR